ncbi:hypothetical protein B0H17DRAFT_1190835 [Mycena rosella]|uniref:F-box domain-containing protein n=1 Tax=Mycena rosella TaxID=1033263 RepID=A0AAD7MBT3_MYCRO|nr:hypothetical protein B0H17DRAFT_1190835 [Mycena rosella]
MSSSCSIQPQICVDSPELRLPPEILMQVFAECCSEQDPIHTSIAVILSWVSWEWRTIALAMPELWASFSFKIAQLSLGQSEQRDEIIFRLLRLHLERSAGHPLSFDADFSKAKASPAALYLISLLAEHSERWASAKLPFSSVFSPIFVRLNGHLGRLESLDLKLQGIQDPNEGLYSTYFAVAPRLRRLTLGSGFPRKIPFPNEQLLELHLGAPATLEMLQFLTLCPCPNLTRLVLNPYYPLKLHGPQTLPAFLHLHTLILAIRDGYSRNPIIEILNLLTAPSLQTLEIVGVGEIQLPPHTFASFLERSGCAPQTLSITFKDNLPVPILLRNLRALPSLTRFVVLARGKDAMDSVALILQALMVNLSDPFDAQLLPNLASLELQTASFHPALLDMVASRVTPIPGGARLETLTLRNTPDTEADRKRLQSFQDSGMRVVSLGRYKPCRSTLFI